MRILAILDRLDIAAFILETTGELASRLQCRDIRVLQPRPATDPDYQSPDEGMPSDEERTRFTQDISRRAAGLHKTCRDWAKATGHVDDVHWVETAGDIRQIVAREAAGADLVVLGRPRPADPDYASQAFAGALYDAQAAVVVAPLQHHATVGAHPVVAWHPSAKLERAIESVWPLLEKAQAVTVIIGENRSGAQPDPALVGRLRDRGVPVTVDRFIITERDTGEQIRARALSARGDLLVMGAYDRPYFIEWLFGGPTRDILTHGTLPLLTHH
ncbi:universal stress protein [Komagataeibacter sp. FNDCF1]|uniref:universal stress protein n=1 Tax=Komagataeibacter sp. FNDCF1 TaxID=2878681 RepID=UPI001E50FB32|nr:universal stress protein [Komagataeibacter sp. FNDCF1]MCE2564539.1 universal stress protein [Komagataeibacter sp. FNDCF1]